MERLRKLREDKKLSQLQLGMKISSSQETISGYEIGRSEPNLATLVKLADTLDASIDYILGRTDVRTVIRSSEFTPQETELLTTFRGLSNNNKERALGMVSALRDIETD